MADNYGRPKCPVCGRIYEQEGDTLFYSTHVANNSLPRRQWPKNLKYSSARPCGTTCERAIRWTGPWNGSIVRFKMEDNDGNGDCLFKSVNRSGVVNISRGSLMDWLYLQHSHYVSDQNQHADLTAELEALGMKMATHLHHYRLQQDLFLQDLTNSVPEAVWLQGVLEQCGDLIEIAFIEMDDIVRTPKFLSIYLRP